MFIQNRSIANVKANLFRDPGPNSMLIQVLDTGYEEWPIPNFKFREVHRFNFLDVEYDHVLVDLGISDEQAEEIAKLLLHAKEEGMNVIVHCHAGLCRSGAITEAGVRLGFEDTGNIRIPNRLVLDKLCEELGLTGRADYGRIFAELLDSPN